VRQHGVDAALDDLIDLAGPGVVQVLDVALLELLLPLALGLRLGLLARGGLVLLANVLAGP
jgi:hypothetical protein